ncbi:MAG: MBL fold metallo-hydrolase [Steroidobacteraceae bacterium]|nr:MBL fold metallo-hydrolase [Steroidobacteraceae bacterium]
MKSIIVVLVASVTSCASAAARPVTAPPPETIAPGVTLLRGDMLPMRGPDGNTVVFEAPEGLVVIDTGRHAWHSDAILALAAARGKPVATIVNTHWHLDHSSGNGRIKAAHPGARLYATAAVDRALADGGFLARNLVAQRPRLEDPDVSAAEKDEIEIFVQTMAERESLRPDVVVGKGGLRRLAGRKLDLRVTDRAVTEADIWIYDRRTGVAVVGDLVTLPAPFFETACPDQWRAALDEVWAVPFRSAIPGHGEPMSRVQFDTYRGAFNAFMDCVTSDAAPQQCAAGWQAGVASLLGDERMRRMALGYAEYYVDMLRANGGRSSECRPGPG